MDREHLLRSGCRESQGVGKRPGSGTGAASGASESLQDRLHRLNRLEQRDRTAAILERRRLLDRFREACEQVGQAHQRLSVHGNLAPAVIRLEPDGPTAIHGWERSGSPSPVAAAYREPSPQPGPRQDVYSLGAILYHILTGRAPGRSPRRRPRQINPTLDRRLEAVCLKALADRPADRYASARLLAEDLERALAGLPLREDAPAAAVSPTVLRAGLALLALLVLVGLTGSLQALRRDNQALRRDNARWQRALGRSEAQISQLEKRCQALDRGRMTALLHGQEEAEARERADWRWNRTAQALRDLALGVRDRHLETLDLDRRLAELESLGPLDPAMNLALAETLAAVAAVSCRLDAPASALPTIRAAARRLQGLPPDSGLDPRTRASCLIDLAETLSRLDQPDEARSIPQMIPTPLDADLAGRLLALQADTHLIEAMTGSIEAPDPPDPATPDRDLIFALATDLAHCAQVASTSQCDAILRNLCDLLGQGPNPHPVPPEWLQREPAFAPFLARTEFQNLLKDLYHQGFPDEPFGGPIQVAASRDAFFSEFGSVRHGNRPIPSVESDCIDLEEQRTPAVPTGLANGSTPGLPQGRENGQMARP